MNAEELEKFTDLYEKIVRLKAVKCRYNHERIRYDKENNLPFAECLPELGYQVIGFCSPEIRAERISCGHTMARYLLENALSLLTSKGVATEYLQVELREVTHRIHSLDHEKGFAEKRLARLIEKTYSEPENDLSAEIEKAKNEIKSIGDLHDQCVDKIGKVRDLIAGKMNLFIRS